MTPLFVRLVIVFLAGACIGSFVNWAIYALAWNRRHISPWMPAPANAPPRKRSDRFPVFGWLALRREAHLHGRFFWIRPLCLEIGLGAVLAALYWWEIEQLGLIQCQVGAPIDVPLGPLHWQFISHALLLFWTLAASVIDIDEKTVPDEITVTGALLGMVLATLAPMSLLPHVAERFEKPVVGVPIQTSAGQPFVGPNGGTLWLEPTTPIAPNRWPPGWAQPGNGRSLAVALGCYWLWCFALAPRIWRGRRGAAVALGLIGRRLLRELGRPPLNWLLIGGTVAIALVWATGEAAWCGLLTALVGLAGSGGIVWAVRLIGTAALRREAMGFGDVTLMMMVGTFLGWQACILTFFLAPLAAIVVGVVQFILRSDDVLPFIPYLCIGAATVVVGWAPIWMWAQPLFQWDWLVPAVLVMCLGMLGILLAIWRMIKELLFGGDTAE